MNQIIPFHPSTKIKHGCSITTSYVSLINPFILSNYSFENYRRFSYLKPNEKIYVKQSYMILTWFYYLNFVNKKNVKKIASLRFYVAPKIRKKFTITKAPIAHKTRSKEQILFTFFKFNMFFDLYFFSTLTNFSFYTSTNQVLFSILLTKNSIALSETNLLFLKKKKIFTYFYRPFLFFL